MGNQEECQKREILSLVGKLTHATKVIPHCRAFLRRLIDGSCKATQLDHWIHLPAGFKSDVMWWLLFLRSWNGRSMMNVHSVTQPPTIEFSSYASGSWGCGAVWDSEWFQFEWKGSWVNESIATKELLPITLACAMWGYNWQHQRVLVHCDNMAVVQLIKSFSSKDPIILHLLQCLHFITAHFDILLTAQHIPGVLNVLADAVSRNHLQVLRQERPLAAWNSHQVPEPLVQLLVSQRPDWMSPTWRELLNSSLSAAWHQALVGPTTQGSQTIWASAGPSGKNQSPHQKSY